MTGIRTLLGNLVLAYAVLLIATPAEAQPVQIDRTWVASTGSGTACTRTAPCATFVNAHAATAPAGLISVLDPGDYGSLTITKPITIESEALAAVTTGFAIDSIGIDVTVRNLTFRGVSGGATAGIDFRSGRALQVENCIFENYVSGPGSAGIRFRPSEDSRLVITDTVVRNNGFSGTGGGIVVSPQSFGAVVAALNRVSVNRNVFGIVADGTGSTTGIIMTIADSVSAANSQDSIVATTPNGGAGIVVVVKNSRAVGSRFGIRAIGPQVSVRVDGTSIAGNITGISFVNGGQVLSYGNNNLDSNGLGDFSGTVALK
jgi:hypothetical protein